VTNLAKNNLSDFLSNQTKDEDPFASIMKPPERTSELAAKATSPSKDILASLGKEVESKDNYFGNFSGIQNSNQSQ
jgi:hypothetical protein